MEPIYIRTDKNGTKYYYDWTCPRCGGAGFCDKWINTGRVCYECGGTGKRFKAKVIKEYTPEYWAKLEARRQAKAKKYAEDHAEEIAQAEAEHERREAEYRKAEFIRGCKEFGCGEDGIGYALTGKTYPVKDQIKANGGKWIAMTWVSPVEVKANDVHAFRIDLHEFINEHGYIAKNDVQDVIYCIGQKRMTYKEAKEQVAEWNAEG